MLKENVKTIVDKTHGFRNARDKVNMLLQGLWVILD